MKVTKREKTLLKILGILIIGVLYFQFIITPKLTRINDLQLKVEEYRERVEQIKKDIASENPVNKEYKIVNSKILFATKNIFPEIIQEKIITYIDAIAKKSNLELNSIVFGDISIEKIDKLEQEDKNSNYKLKDLVKAYNDKKAYLKKDKGEESSKAPDKESPPSEAIDSRLERMDVTINYNGSYDNLMKFIKEIEDYNKKIIVDTLSLAKTEGGEMVGNITLKFYSIPKLYDSDDDKEYREWDIINKYGKDNPFNPFSGYTANKKSDNGAEKKAPDYDFIMSVKPISSDLPTIILGKSKDREMKSYIYEDNPDFSRVEFQINQEGNKYYFKYKTNSDSYPKSYKGEGIEFKPQRKSINFNIRSYKRNGSQDNSGVDLSLINKSDIELKVHIDNEDNKKPRINIIEKIGDISVSK